MSYTEEQLWQLLDQAYHMPYGPGQIALVEQIIAHADAQHLTPLAFAARMQATSSYVYGGERARSFSTFAWCLAEFDRNPQAYRHQYRTLLWHFKYMVSALTKFPEVPLERTYGVLDDMQRRWQETGHSLHAVHAYRHQVAAHIGDLDAARAHYEQWCAAPRDDLSDCVGCDPTQKAAWLALCGRDEEAVALGDPVLRGELTCREQPQSMLTTLMVSYLRTGRLDAARDAHRRAYRRHRPNLADLEEIADHIAFSARTGNEARAVEMVERHLGWLDRAPSPWAAMIFAAASSLALRRAQERHADGELAVHRPAYGERAAGDVSAPALAAELAASATELAERFDRRNGTDRVGTLVRELLVGEPWVAYLPLSPTAAPPRRATPAHSTVEQLFARTTPPPPVPPPTAAPSPPAQPVDVPPTAGPDELLDLIEQYEDADDEARFRAALDALDARYGERELTVRQRARVTDAHAARVAGDRDFAEASRLWREAAARYAEVGDAEQERIAQARASASLCWFGERDDELLRLVEATDWLLANGSARARVAAATRLAIVHYNAGRHEQALTVLDRATASVDEAPLATRARHAVIRVATLGQLQRVDEVRQTGPAAIELATEAGLGEDGARAHSTLAAALRDTGDLTSAADHLAAAIGLLTDEQDRDRLDLARAELLARTERAGEVIDGLVERVAESTARGDLGAAADARRILAIAYLNSERHLDAAEVAEEELAYRLHQAEASPRSGAVAAVRDLLATIYQRLGHPIEAVEQLDAIADELAGDRAVVGQLAQRTGEILAGADRDEEAAARFLQAADICAEIDQPLAELYNRRRHAISLRWAGRTEDALAALAGADAAASRITPDGETSRWELARLEFDAARILAAAGRLGEAAARAGRAAQASLELDSPGSAAESRLMQARILLDAGAPESARAAIEQALAVLPDGADREPYDQIVEAVRRASGPSS